MDEFMTRKEVCQLLKISLSTIIRWEKQGILKAYRPGGKKVLYRREDIEKIFQEGGPQKE